MAVLRKNEIPYSDFQTLSIIGAYLPLSDHPIQEYTDWFVELESAVSALQAEGPVMIAGGFNAWNQVQGRSLR